MTIIEIWTFRSENWAETDLRGFTVAASDGDIGKVDEAAYDAGASFLVVDTGPWVFGKKVMLPAGVIEHVDCDEEKVHVSRTKDEIEDAPEFDEGAYRTEGYRSKVGSYYELQKERAFQDHV
jgi:hypothetical protein